MITTASSADGVEAAALLQRVFENDLSTVEGLRHRMKSARPEDRIAWWKAVEGSRIVGWAVAGINTFTAESGRAFASVAVHPAARRRGHGSSLWNAASAHLDSIAATRTALGSLDDDASKRFARARDFIHASTDTMLGVDPRTVASVAVPVGLDLCSLSTFSDDPRPVHRCAAEAAQDEPGPFDLDAITFEAWTRQIWAHPDLDRDLSIAAIDDGQVLGTTFLFTDRTTGRAVNGGTGVVRSHRGHGIGLAMKLRSLSLAAEAGIERIVTYNDESNAPMLAINRRLGYSPPRNRPLVGARAPGRRFGRVRRLSPTPGARSRLRRAVLTCPARLSV